MAYALLILSGLLVVAWPFLAFGSIFLFDAPSKGLISEIVRNTIFIGVLTYPVGYLYAIWQKEPGKRFKDDARTIFFLASPFVQLSAMYVLGQIAG